eukprot:TRINITY_DN2995_c0_g1_i1.p3 TRINITY_DN2995_c0_g1~~TRINITY_DN2995_c0_g1_i1.p3  ORF type:complete len:147 (-),score=18.09 TRINITY_DN2995_c0_g1_i1:54-494(-)
MAEEIPSALIHSPESNIKQGLQKKEIGIPKKKTPLPVKPKVQEKVSPLHHVSKKGPAKTGLQHRRKEFIPQEKVIPAKAGLQERAARAKCGIDKEIAKEGLQKRDILLKNVMGRDIIREGLFDRGVHKRGPAIVYQICTNSYLKVL